MPNGHAYIRPVLAEDTDPFETPTDRTFQILIVDDQEETAIALAELLQMDGFLVSKAFDGATALAAASNGTFDAVVLDVRMPGMDGFEVCRRLRADHVTSNVVVVLTTGLDDIESKLEGLSDGADDYLVKPIEARELGSRLRRLLAARDTRSRDRRLPHQQMVGAVTTAICQEINDPLTAALGSVDLLLLTRHLAPDVRRELDECQRQLIRIGRILGRLDNHIELGT